MPFEVSVFFLVTDSLLVNESQITNWEGGSLDVDLRIGGHEWLGARTIISGHPKAYW